jgi:acetyl-CoA carboxylase biotin carboxyl carrier protein
MDFKQIQELINLISETGLSEFRLEEKEFKLTIRSKDYFEAQKSAREPKIITIPAGAPMQMQPQYAPMPVAPQMPVASAPTAPPPPAPSNNATPPPAAAAAAAAANDESRYIKIVSPIVGTFYRSPSPEKPPYLKIGDTVKPNTIVCIVEAMKLFNEIEAEVSGKIIKILTDDASPVEYGQPLFLVDPNG